MFWYMKGGIRNGIAQDPLSKGPFRTGAKVAAVLGVERARKPTGEWSRLQRALTRGGRGKRDTRRGVETSVQRLVGLTLKKYF